MLHVVAFCARAYVKFKSSGTVHVSECAVYRITLNGHFQQLLPPLSLLHTIVK